jgi:hypothetical protein
LVSTVAVWLHTQVLVLELIGFVLPYARQAPVAAAAGPAATRFSPTTAVRTAVNATTVRVTRLSTFTGACTVFAAAANLLNVISDSLVGVRVLSGELDIACRCSLRQGCG